jgi:hypothetical protein
MVYVPANTMGGLDDLEIMEAMGFEDELWNYAC